MLAPTVSKSCRLALGSACNAAISVVVPATAATVTSELVKAEDVVPLRQVGDAHDDADIAGHVGGGEGDVPGPLRGDRKPCRDDIDGAVLERIEQLAERQLDQLERHTEITSQLAGIVDIEAEQVAVRVTHRPWQVERGADPQDPALFDLRHDLGAH